MSNMKERFELYMADDQKRKLVIFAVLAVVLVVLVMVIFEEPEKKPLRLNEEAKVRHAMLAPDDIADLDEDRVQGLLDNYKEDLDRREKQLNATEAKTERELDRVNKELEMLRDELKSEKKANERLELHLADLSEKTTVLTQDPELVAYLQEQSVVYRDRPYDAGSIAPTNPSGDPMATMVRNTTRKLSNNNSAIPEGESKQSVKLGIKSISGIDVDRHTGAAPEQMVDGKPVSPDPNAEHAASLKKQAIEEAKKAEEENFFLPAGSILSGTLLTGLDAPTAGGAKNEPWPALLRIKMEAILPNRWTLDVRECFLIAGAYGDLSSERAYMRAETLSCVRTDGRAIEVAFDAFGVGGDGKAGIRGRVVHKNGQLIAQSLLAGFVSGIADATKPQAIPTLDTTEQNGRTTFNEPYFEDVMRAGGYSGASNAAERIAEYLLDVASDIFPVIEIDAGRQMDFVLQRGVMLRIR